MSRSCAFKSKASARQHPYTRKRPVDPASKSAPSEATINQTLRRSARCTTNKYRSVMSSLNVDGTYDPDVPLQTIEFHLHQEPHSDCPSQLQSPRSPEPLSRSASVVSAMKDEDLAAATAGEQKHGKSKNSYVQHELVNFDPVKYVVFDIIGRDNNRDVMEALEYCRICFDQDANQIDRYVTDCAQTSGRVYDRLTRCELKRLIPFVGDNVSGKSPPEVFDILTGEIRRRLLYDDFRDCNARIRGHLEITEGELQKKYDGISFP